MRLGLNLAALHHIIHWADGGPTNLTNLALLCDYHHRVVHTQDWEIHIIDGHPEFVPPAWLDKNRTPIRNTMHDPPLDGERAA